MTEFLEGDTLRRMARLISIAATPVPRTVPIMAWRIDETTQRPVCEWKLDAKPPSPRCPQ